jgi:hypothetical protein
MDHCELDERLADGRQAFVVLAEARVRSNGACQRAYPLHESTTTAIASGTTAAGVIARLSHAKRRWSRSAVPSGYLSTKTG